MTCSPPFIVYIYIYKYLISKGNLKLLKVKCVYYQKKKKKKGEVCIYIYKVFTRPFLMIVFFIIISKYTNQFLV